MFSIFFPRRDKLPRMTGIASLPVVVDLSREDQIREMFREVIRTYGGLVREKFLLDRVTGKEPDFSYTLNHPWDHRLILSLPREARILKKAPL